jgi:hypothetical protein
MDATVTDSGRPPKRVHRINEPRRQEGRMRESPQTQDQRDDDRGVRSAQRGRRRVGRAIPGADGVSRGYYFIPPDDV